MRLPVQIDAVDESSPSNFARNAQPLARLYCAAPFAMKLDPKSAIACVANESVVLLAGWVACYRHSP
jgi:hypothetical protein